MVANLDVNNLKSKWWGQQKRIDTDTCERKNENRCQQLENRNDKRQVAPILATGIVAELTLEYKWVAITNGQYESGNWDGAWQAPYFALITCLSQLVRGFDPFMPV